MNRFVVGRDFERWRSVARALAATDALPATVDLVSEDDQASLFGAASLPTGGEGVRVAARFVELAQWVSWNKSPQRWNLLYAALFRLTHGEKHLLELVTDPLVEKLRELEQQCRYDEHKARAFVRFKSVQDEGGERYVAFYRPDHFIVRAVAPFFADRFSHRWSLLTPDESAHYNGETLSFGPGATDGRAVDDLEQLWRTYYANIFNPARVNPRAMRQHMPTRFHALMPETQLIKPLVREAERRVRTMQTGQRSASAAFVPRDGGLEGLRAALPGCSGCDLCAKATAPVFGEGRSTAKLMLVGEQPGDMEDQQGRPFVGPAGALLDELLREVGIAREETYVTNAVKAFKYAYDGKRRLHQKPSTSELRACRAWLDAEVATVKPKVIVCLGASAAQSFLGPKFSLTRSRGEAMSTPWAETFLTTYHPAAVLRAPDASSAEQLRAAMRDDLRRAVAALKVSG